MTQDQSLDSELPNASKIKDKNGVPTLCGMLNFGSFPQMFSPNLDIVAVRCATNEYGRENEDGIRFIDNKRIDGTLSNMIQQALSFIQNNTKIPYMIENIIKICYYEYVKKFFIKYKRNT